ncbi:MAG: antibiotic biosynthesis monooxygenase [Candidatus Eremiobacteraeota bacterium]|nr:antibiotic biosynthesis monooxygenase [Candidatus Eremiobacteraeota bacterium]
MLVLAVTYVIKAGHETEAIECLKRLTAEARDEPGNRMFVAHRAQDDPRTFFLYEQYDDQAALDAHRATPHFERYGKNGLQAIAESRHPALYVPLEA